MKVDMNGIVNRAESIWQHGATFRDDLGTITELDREIMRYVEDVQELLATVSCLIIPDADPRDAQITELKRQLELAKSDALIRPCAAPGHNYHQGGS